MKNKSIFRFIIVCVILPWTLSAAEGETASNQQQQQQSQQQHLPQSTPLQQSQQPAQQQQSQPQQKKPSNVQYSEPFYNSINFLSNSNDNFKPFTPIYSTPIYSPPPPISQIKEPPSRIKPTTSLQPNFSNLPLAASPTPVLMQYFPHSQFSGPPGIQYLQLVPTRPLFFPFNPYLTQLQQQNQIPSTTTNTNTADLSAGKNAAPMSAAASEQTPVNVVHVPSYAFYTSNGGGHQNGGPLVGAYSSPTPTLYKYFRSNHGLELMNPPPDFTLNTMEYIPTSNDSPHSSRPTRGRP